ncbi:MAG: hypothetical protein WD016_05200 [Balneolaceae bacterium]
MKIIYLTFISLILTAGGYLFTTDRVENRKSISAESAKIMYLHPEEEDLITNRLKFAADVYFVKGNSIRGAGPRFWGVFKHRSFLGPDNSGLNISSVRNNGGFTLRFQMPSEKVVGNGEHYPVFVKGNTMIDPDTVKTYIQNGEYIIDVEFWRGLPNRGQDSVFNKAHNLVTHIHGHLCDPDDGICL